jgi:hypothetical protein
VVVLVTGKGGSAGEGLLAISVRALVRALSRMSPAVTSKGAAVAERLRIVRTFYRRRGLMY